MKEPRGPAGGKRRPTLGSRISSRSARGPLLVQAAAVALQPSLAVAAAPMSRAAMSMSPGGDIGDGGYCIGEESSTECSTMCSMTEDIQGLAHIVAIVMQDLLHTGVARTGYDGPDLRDEFVEGSRRRRLPMRVDLRGLGLDKRRLPGRSGGGSGQIACSSSCWW